MSRTGLRRRPQVPIFQPIFASGTCLESWAGLDRWRSYSAKLESQVVSNPPDSLSHGNGNLNFLSITCIDPLATIIMDLCDLSISFSVLSKNFWPTSFVTKVLVHPRSYNASRVTDPISTDTCILPRTLSVGTMPLLKSVYRPLLSWNSASTKSNESKWVDSFAITPPEFFGVKRVSTGSVFPT